MKLWRYVGLATILTMAGCADSLTEDQRIPSPTRAFDAVVATKATGATVPTPTEVFVVRSGAQISGDPAFLADKVEDLRVSWASDSVVVIHARAARVFSHVSPISVESGRSTVKVELDIQKPIT